MLGAYIILSHGKKKVSNKWAGPPNNSDVHGLIVWNCSREVRKSKGKSKHQKTEMPKSIRGILHKASLTKIREVMLIYTSWGAGQYLYVLEAQTLEIYSVSHSHCLRIRNVDCVRSPKIDVIYFCWQRKKIAPSFLHQKSSNQIHMIQMEHF